MRRVRTPPRFPPRPPDAHKASVGRVLVVGGSRDMCGAPALAALGALRAGAGLVRIAVPASSQSTVAAIRPEATTAGLPEGPGGGLSAEVPPVVDALLAGWDAVVLGCGGGRTEDAVAAFRMLARDLDRPMVIDADALFALGSDLAWLHARGAATVLTPHEGEAGRLLDRPSAEVRADREGAALALARASGAGIVLKGPGTLVCDGARLFRCARGGPWLATGGTGDVLAGVVGAFLAGLPATGGDAFGAACAAVHVHAAAADAAARGIDRGLLASDVDHALPRALAGLVQRRRGTRAGRR